MNSIYVLAEAMTRVAIAKYAAVENSIDERGHRPMYDAVIEGLDSANVSYFFGDAHALCGNPYHGLSHVEWTEEELTVLKLFVDW